MPRRFRSIPFARSWRMSNVMRHCLLRYRRSICGMRWLPWRPWWPQMLVPGTLRKRNWAFRVNCASPNAARYFFSAMQKCMPLPVAGTECADNRSGAVDRPAALLCPIQYSGVGNRFGMVPIHVWVSKLSAQEITLAVFVIIVVHVFLCIGSQQQQISQSW